MTQQNLFTTNEPASHEPQNFEFHFLSVAAHKKIQDADPSFLFFSSEVLDGGGFLLTGATSSCRYKSGPRNGRPKYDGEELRVFVSEEEVSRAEAEYEEETGFCHKCLGSGRVVVRVSVIDGTTYKPCARCDGTGFFPTVCA